MASPDAVAIIELHARVCKALADPKRLLIINELRDGPQSVGEIAAALATSQPNASRHLALLRDRGIVIGERAGSTVFYTLTSPRILRAVDLLREFMTEELGWRPAALVKLNDAALGQAGADPVRAPVSRPDAQEIYELYARVCRALADPKRLLIINELRAGPRTAGELVAALGINQANASQHLAVLRDRGVVTARRVGSNVYYALASTKVAEAIDLLCEFMAEWRPFGRAHSPAKATFTSPWASDALANRQATIRAEAG